MGGPREPVHPLTVLHVAPHPDDEALGAGATLLGLREAGHRVLNLACSLGRPEDRERRAAEAEEACRRAGFELVVHDPPLLLSEDPGAEEALAATVQRLLEESGAALVVSPGPHDGHPAHEAVGRAVLRALAARAHPPRWWTWGLWADLPLPTLLVPFGEERLSAALAVLAAHAGEVRRADYPRLLRARAAANAVLGAERVSGFGGPGLEAPYAELLCESFPGDGWRAGEPRVPDLASPLAGEPSGPSLESWLREPSPRARLDAELRPRPGSR